MTDIEIVEKPRTTVSHSEVESYLRCERQHYYGYGLEIERISESDSLHRGKLGHSCLEAFFNALKDGKDFDTAKQLAFLRATEEIGRAPGLVNEVVDCLTWFFEGYPFHGWTILAVEIELVLSVTDELQMPFIVDLVAKDIYGDVWVIDHKFMYDFITDRDAELMPQLPKYVAALRVLGYQVDKTAYSVLRYRSLKTPTVDSKYKFIPTNITDERLKQTITEQLKVSARIIERKKESLAEWSADAMRTANKMVCNNCSFRSLCVAELNDYQPQLILDSDYKKKERREFKEIEASQ